MMTDARPWLMARCKAHDRLSIRVNWTFSLSITVPELWAEMCTARLFSQGVNLFALNFTRTVSSPSNHSWHQKTSDTRLLDGEHRIPLRSFVLAQYRSVTDRQTDGFAVVNIYSACKASQTRQYDTPPSDTQKRRVDWIRRHVYSIVELFLASNRHWKRRRDVRIEVVYAAPSYL